MKKKLHSGTRTHVPVMPKEVISCLNIIPNGIYIDGTIGIGGHSSLIISLLSKKGHLIGIDRDEEALKMCKKRFSSQKNSLSLFKESYHQFNSILDRLGINQVNGIFLDLGLSSLQLDSKNRGFSFKINANLDMRFDQSQKTKASHIINQFSQKDLANIIYRYGEERRSRIIAKNIVKKRPLKTVFDLVEAIRKSTPPNKRNKSIARVFQALRITVNNELEKLDIFLSSFYKRLCLGGRIVIISFHSLEDRKVKQCFNSFKKENKLKILFKKPLYPSLEELEKNMRSKSAKLRAAEKIN